MTTQFDEFINNSFVDVVSIFTQDYTQVLVNSKPIKLSVNPASKLMEHPIETGAVITDFKITLPTELDLSLILLAEDYKNIYQEIQNLFINSTLLIVQTKASTYSNQIISSIPHEESPENFDIINISLKMKEVLFVTAQFGGFVPKDPKKTPTQKRGEQGGSQPTPAKEKNAGSYLGGQGFLK